MKNKYLSVGLGCGFDWHDYYQTQEFLKGENGYAVSDGEIQDLIVQFICERFPSSPEYMDGVKSAVINKKEYEYPIYYNGSLLDADVCSASITIEKDGLPSVNAQYNGYCTDASFSVMEIEEGKERYYVSERFLAPYKGCPCVDRMYHLPFKDVNEAEAYKKTLQADIEKYATMAGSCRYLNFSSSAAYEGFNSLLEKADMPDNIRRTAASEAILQICGDSVNELWYRLQEQAISLMEKTKTSAFDPMFDLDVEKHILRMKGCAEKHM